MPKLLLANPYSRAMAARLQDIPKQVTPYYDAMADRLLWTLAVDDIAVVAGSVKKEFLSYMCAVLGMQPDSISVLSLADYESANWYPGHNPGLVADLRSRISSRRPVGDWRISCYIRDRDVAAWERVLGMSDAASDAFADNMAEMMNTKSVFRVLARAAGFPIADGRVVTHGDELYDAVAELLAVTGAVIVKQDMNSGGDGNVFVTSDPDIRGDGARWSVQVAGRDTAEIRRTLSEVGLGDPPDIPAGCAPGKYVVEVFHPHSLSFYAELDVPRDGPPRLCNYGDLRMTPLWSGFEIPARRLTTEQREQLCIQALRLARLAQSIGYSGHFDCDAILTREGELIFNEFNGRAGGATHMDVLCRRLLGTDYLDEVVLLTRNAVRSPAFHKLMLALDDDSLHFERERGAGIIVTQDNTAHTGTIEYISIGRTHAEAAFYEHRLEEILRRSV
jgi:hypothetical protein